MVETWMQTPHELLEGVDLLAAVSCCHEITKFVTSNAKNLMNIYLLQVWNLMEAIA